MCCPNDEELMTVESFKRLSFFKANISLPFNYSLLGMRSIKLIIKENNMKIAYFNSCFPKLSETFIQREVRAIRAQGLHPIIVSNRPPKSYEFHPDDKKFIQETFYLKPIQLWPYVRSNLKLFFKSPVKYLNTLKLALFLKDDDFPLIRYRNIARLAGAAVLADHLLKKNVSHVHVHFAYGAAGVAIFLEKLTGISYSLSIHGSDVLLRQPLIREKLARAQFIRSNCKFHEDNLKSKFPSLRQKRFHVVRLGIDLDSGRWSKAKPCQSGRPLRILNVARLIPVKGHAILIKACALLKNRGVAFHCRIVGDGASRKELEMQISRLNLNDSIELMGAKYETQVAEFFEWSHIFVLSSLSEGTPMTVIEAMAKARPVIVPDTTALPEMVVHGKTGYLFKRGSSEELAEQLYGLAQRPDLTQIINKLGMAGRKRAENLFNRTDNSKKLLNVFTKEIGNQLKL